MDKIASELLPVALDMLPRGMTIDHDVAEETAWRAVREKYPSCPEDFLSAIADRILWSLTRRDQIPAS